MQNQYHPRFFSLFSLQLRPELRWHSPVLFCGSPLLSPGCLRQRSLNLFILTSLITAKFVDEQSMDLGSWEVGLRAEIFLSKLILHWEVRKTDMEEKITSTNHSRDDGRKKQNQTDRLTHQSIRYEEDMTRQTQSGTPPDDVAMTTGNGYCCGLDVKGPSKNHELKA